MKLLSNTDIQLISGGETHYGLTKANWATLFGLVAKTGMDAYTSAILPTGTGPALKAFSMIVSSTVGLYVGFSSFNYLDESTIIFSNNTTTQG